MKRDNAIRLIGLLLVSGSMFCFGWQIRGRQYPASSAALPNIVTSYDYYIQLGAAADNVVAYRKKGEPPCGTVGSDVALDEIIRQWTPLVGLRGIAETSGDTSPAVIGDGNVVTHR